MGTLYCLLTPVHKKKQHATLKIMLGKLERNIIRKIQRMIYCKKNCFCEADEWWREENKQIWTEIREGRVCGNLNQELNN